MEYLPLFVKNRNKPGRVSIKNYQPFGSTPKGLEAYLLVLSPYLVACFLRRLRQSAIMAINSEFVGFPLILLTV